MTAKPSPLDSSNKAGEARFSTSKEEENQNARAFLRERFIRAMTAMSRTTKFRMYQNTNVSGAFASCDREFVHLYVKNLETPIGIVTEALLRTNDIESISIDEIDPSV